MAVAAPGAARMTGIIAENSLSLAIVAIFFLCSLWMLGRILKRAGFHLGWSLLMWLPVVNLVAVWAFAYLEWPGPVTTEGKRKTP
jgi:hypothetical protein